MPTYKCTVCHGIYAQGLFVNLDPKECRMCSDRRYFESRLAEKSNQIESLLRRISVLEGAAVQNDSQGVDSSITAATPPAATDLPQTPAPRTTGLTNVSGEDNSIPTATPSAAQVVPSTPTPPTVSVNPPPTITSATQQEFQTVRRGFRPNKRSYKPATTIQNRFRILADLEDEPQEVRLVGDSILRGQLPEFCGRAPGNRKRFCMPGAGVSDISQSLDEVMSDTTDVTNNPLLLVHVGTNDVKRSRPEELIDRYRTLIQRLKSKSKNVIISGILPRIRADWRFYSKALAVNKLLNSLCSQEGITFVNLWKSFARQQDMFAKDGLHLSAIGSARFGRLMDEAVCSFWSKNAQHSGEASEQA